MATRRRSTRRETTEPAPRGERLQKLLASAGVASRRAAEELMLAGRVSVNGAVVRELGVRVDPQRDRVQLDGKRLEPPRERSYYVLYKPRGVISSAKDPHAGRTVLDLVPSCPGLFPVGRLDAQSEGLLLLTNDGPVAHALLHPSFGIQRIYRVSVTGALRAAAMRELGVGVVLADGERCAPCELRLLSQAEDHSVVELVLVEGRRHQIRKMMEAVGHPVRRLVRVSHGPFAIGNLRPGTWRSATARELAALRRITAQALPPGRSLAPQPTRRGPGRNTPGRSAPGRSTSGRSAPGRSAPGRGAPGRSASGHAERAAPRHRKR
jgi:23S rRNA pseudouridine2605 synthase